MEPIIQSPLGSTSHIQEGFNPPDIQLLHPLLLPRTSVQYLSFPHTTTICLLFIEDIGLKSGLFLASSIPGLKSGATEKRIMEPIIQSPLGSTSQIQEGFNPPDIQSLTSSSVAPDFSPGRERYKK
jgi:hypothetical protein